MNKQKALDVIGNKATGLASSAAGTVVDPKAGLNKLTSKAAKPAFLLTVAAVALAWLLGRRGTTARH
ncbi:hypothetical protein [Actinoplanes sp. NPDC051411]|uniref:hypothetical protein n=1 Tax=unclassified Actinoplanes TaxID=2626549 RepID=UPI00342A563F